MKQLKHSFLLLALVAGCGSSSKPEATTKQAVLPANEDVSAAPAAAVEQPAKPACPEIPPEQETISFCELAAKSWTLGLLKLRPLGL